MVQMKNRFSIQEYPPSKNVKSSGGPRCGLSFVMDDAMLSKILIACVFTSRISMTLSRSGPNESIANDNWCIIGYALSVEPANAIAQSDRGSVRIFAQ